ncbi:hypothetical protein CCP3SC1_310024 [Gammaproteobacteria bacterium]
MPVCRLMTGTTVWHLTADPAVAGWLALYAQRLELSAATPEEQPARRLHLSGPIARLPAEAVPLLHFSDLEIAVLPSGGDLYARITPSDDPDIVTGQMCRVTGVIHHAMVGTGGLPLHAALVTLKGRAYLIAASGGTGKSTCHGRIPPPWEGLCDDEAQVNPRAEGFTVQPFPTWSVFWNRLPERSWPVERALPLAAVFFLEQAERDFTEMLTPAHACARLMRAANEAAFRGIGRHLADAATLRLRLLDNAAAMIRTVPTYRLGATLDGRFWEAMEGVL